jgi:hypothetical protein
MAEAVGTPETRVQQPRLQVPGHAPGHGRGNGRGNGLGRGRGRGQPGVGQPRALVPAPGPGVILPGIPPVETPAPAPAPGQRAGPSSGGQERTPVAAPPANLPANPMTVQGLLYIVLLSPWGIYI